jgi:hypothetical protein
LLICTGATGPERLHAPRDRPHSREHDHGACETDGDRPGNGTGSPQRDDDARYERGDYDGDYPQ